MAFPVPTRSHGELISAADWNADVADNLNALHAALADVGDVKMRALGTIPAGWLECNGAAVSRTTYAALFAAIGTTYGAGDASTTFNLPDFRKRLPIGVGDGITLGQQTGAWDHVHTGPSHTHTISGSGTHTHGVSGTVAVDLANVVGAQAGSDFGASTDAHQHTFSVTSDAGGDHNHTGATGSSGTGNTGTANPPVLGITFIIYAAV